MVPIGWGRGTLESLRAVARRALLAGWHATVIVSDPWHLLRTRTMADDLGLDGLDLAHPKRPDRADPDPIQARCLIPESAALHPLVAGPGAGWRQRGTRPIDHRRVGASFSASAVSSSAAKPGAGAQDSGQFVGELFDQPAGVVGVGSYSMRVVLRPVQKAARETAAIVGSHGVARG